MVFWKTFPTSIFLDSSLNLEVFKSQKFSRKQITLPKGLNGLYIKKENKKSLTDVREFLKKYFGKNEKHPIFDIPEEALMGDKDHILVIYDIDKNIVGCSRYHYLGIFVTSTNEEIYCIDCLCVHPTWRGKGIGDYLLVTGHNYINDLNIPFALFLKEGAQLSIFHQPMFSSIYVYKKLESQKQNNVITLTIKQAYTLMDIFRELNPLIFIVRNIKSTNQYWRLYKKDMYKVLACFQDTYQRLDEDGNFKKMGWCTGWIESPNITDEVREEASQMLSDSMINEFDYMWMNKEWIGQSQVWKIDGSFHWYTYQWSTSLNIKKSYCIVN